MRTTPYTVNYKRSVDLFPPKETGSDLLNWDLRDKDIKQLINWLDQEKFTGVLKASSDSNKFRGALILFAGWSIGAIFTALGEESVKHTYKAIPALLAHLSADESSTVEIYTLPEAIVVPFSSAFIGQFMEPAKADSPSQQAKIFVDHVTNLPRHSLITIRTMSETKSELCLVFFYWGKISGHFLVEEQKFSDSSDFPNFIFDQVIDAKIHLSILSPEILGVYSGSTRFGFPLTLDTNKE